MDEFMRASNMVESNLEKLSATLERSLLLSNEDIVSRLPERSISTSRVVDREKELVKKLSVSTMEHVYALRARAEAGEKEGKDDPDLESTLSLDHLIDAHVEDDDSPREVKAPRNPNRFMEGEEMEASLEKAEHQIRNLEDELEGVKKQLAQSQAAKDEVEKKNKSLERAVKELQEALSNSSDNGILEKYNAQKAELQSVSALRCRLFDY
jgi:energy-converting hydrogenase A subunit M